MDYGVTAAVIASFTLIIGITLLYLSTRLNRGFIPLFATGVFFLLLTLLGLPVILVDSIEYGSEPPCEWLQNETFDIYIYGNNFSGEHWTMLSDPPDSSPPPGPPGGTGGPGVSFANYTLFHVNSTNYYDNSCEGRTVPATITAVFTIFTWLVWMSLFASILGFIVFLLKRWVRKI